MAGVLWRPLFDPDFAQEIATAEDKLRRALDAHDANPHLRNANADKRTQILRRQLEALKETTAGSSEDGLSNGCSPQRR